MIIDIGDDTGEMFTALQLVLLVSMTFDTG